MSQAPYPVVGRRWIPACWRRWSPGRKGGYERRRRVSVWRQSSAGAVASLRRPVKATASRLAALDPAGLPLTGRPRFADGGGQAGSKLPAGARDQRYGGALVGPDSSPPVSHTARSHAVVLAGPKRTRAGTQRVPWPRAATHGPSRAGAQGARRSGGAPGRRRPAQAPGRSPQPRRGGAAATTQDRAHALSGSRRKSSVAA